MHAKKILIMPLRGITEDSSLKCSAVFFEIEQNMGPETRASLELLRQTLVMGLCQIRRACQRIA